MRQPNKHEQFDINDIKKFFKNLLKKVKRGTKHILSKNKSNNKHSNIKPLHGKLKNKYSDIYSSETSNDIFHDNDRDTEDATIISIPKNNNDNNENNDKNDKDEINLENDADINYYDEYNENYDISNEPEEDDETIHDAPDGTFAYKNDNIRSRKNLDSIDSYDIDKDEDLDKTDIISDSLDLDDLNEYIENEEEDNLKDKQNSYDDLYSFSEDEATSKIDITDKLSSEKQAEEKNTSQNGFDTLSLGPRSQRNKENAAKNASEELAEKNHEKKLETGKEYIVASETPVKNLNKKKRNVKIKVAKEKNMNEENENIPLWQRHPDKYRKKRPWIIRFFAGLWSFFMFWGLAFGIVAILVGGAAATIIYAFSDPELDEMFANLELDYTSIIYVNTLASSKAVEYEELYNDQNRVWVSAEEMPKYLKDAVVAIEDKRFYEHIGVDPIRTLRATLEYALKKALKQSTEYVAGGSTLTQQLIKTITQTGDDKSPLRKVKEMLQALYIERKYTKDQILEYYLNAVHFGNNCDGIYAAAKYYFDKDVIELTPTECAAIIGITKSPTNMEPYKNPEANRVRRVNILYEMKEQGKIEQAEFDVYRYEELALRDRTAGTASSRIMSWASDMAFEETKTALMETLGYTSSQAIDYIYTGGLRVYTTFVLEFQEIMYNYFRNEDNYIETPEDEEKPEVAMELLDPKTGNVLAVIGGRGEKTSNRLLSRVTQTVRQPGSAIKPLTVYGYAIENNIVTAGTAIDDTPLRIDATPIKLLQNQTYLQDPLTGIEIKNTYVPWPKNYDSRYNGLIDIKTALSYSYNTPSAKLLYKIGVETSYNFAKNMLGLKSLVEQDKNLAPLSVGAFTYGLTLQEVTAAYTAFANGGVYSAPRCVTRIESYDGKIIYENNIDRQIVFTPQTAYIVNDILGNLVGSSKGADLGDIDTSGKSGTTSSFKDRWFIGYTPYYLAGIWWGYDKPNVNENTHHIDMWHEVMSDIHSAVGITEGEFSKPDGLVTTQYCSISGKLASHYCTLDPRGSRVKTGIFKDGTQPTEYCDVHHVLYVCEESGQIAHENCPSAKQAVFIDLPRSYPYAYIYVRDAEYICPPLSANQILYNDRLLPVYSYMLPEGEYPTLATDTSKSRYANTLCNVHTPSATPHYYTYKSLMPPAVSEELPEDDGSVPTITMPKLLSPKDVNYYYNDTSRYTQPNAN